MSFFDHTIGKISDFLGISKTVVTTSNSPFATRGGSVADFNIAPLNDDRVGQPYLKSPWVRTAISLLTDPIVSVPIRFTLNGRGGEKAYENPALISFWEKPAVNEVGIALSFSELIAETIRNYGLYGEAFWLLDDTWRFNRSPKLRSPILSAHPERMSAVLSNGKLVGWKYTDFDYKVTQYDLT